MAATIDLSQVGALPPRYQPGDAVPSLKDQIESGSILRDMYHKKTVQFEEANDESQKEFLKQFSQKQADLKLQIMQEQREKKPSKENPEDVSRGSSSVPSEKVLSFRERLMQKSTVAASYLDVIALN